MTVEKQHSDLFDTLFSTPQAREKLKKLLEEPAATASTPIESAVKQQAEIEHLKVELDNTKRALAAALTDVRALQNTIKNLEDQKRDLFVELDAERKAVRT